MQDIKDPVEQWRYVNDATHKWRSGVISYFWLTNQKRAEVGQQMFGGRTFNKADIQANDSAHQKRAKNAQELWPWYWLPEMRFSWEVLAKVHLAMPGPALSPEEALKYFPAAVTRLWNDLVAHNTTVAGDKPWMEQEAFQLLEECYCYGTLTGKPAKGPTAAEWADGACGSAAKGSKGAPWQCRSRLATAPGCTLHPAFDLARIMSNPNVDLAKERSPAQVAARDQEVYVFEWDNPGSWPGGEDMGRTPESWSKSNLYWQFIIEHLDATDPVKQWRLVNDATYKWYVGKMAAMLHSEGPGCLLLDKEVLAGYLLPATEPVVSKHMTAGGLRMTEDTARVSAVSEVSNCCWPAHRDKATLGRCVFRERSYRTRDIEEIDSPAQKRAKNAQDPQIRQHPKIADKILRKAALQQLVQMGPPMRPQQAQTSATPLPNA
ncbi:hypothetical protein WJX72_006543 [[Myrmecia] bisecta]|uniref:Uncharacterized protein n=1 Tax=[Myrmecia] bisecta TaxID=41462 RepID=A0AAW1P9U5_9CHLO